VRPTLPEKQPEVTPNFNSSSLNFLLFMLYAVCQKDQHKSTPVEKLLVESFNDVITEHP